MALEQLEYYSRFFAFILKYYNSGVVQSTTDSALNELQPENEYDFKETPKELAEDLKKMGPTFVKLGQLLSTRPDLLPDPYLEALAELQDDVETISYEEIQEIFEEEIGVRISKAFQSFDKEPLASASIGQVHRAVLPSGREVVVKVQRPGVRQRFLEDLQTLQKMADLAVSYSKNARKYALDSIVEEMRFILINELDYEKEAQHLRLLRTNLERFDLLMIPDAVPAYSTGKVLTMDYIFGKKITSLGNLRKLETDFTPLVDQLIEAYLQQIIVDGFAHADPHPGNIHLTPNNRLAIMDLGMVAKFSHQLREKITKLLISIGHKNGDEMTDALLAMSEYDHEDEDALVRFRKNLNRLVQENLTTTAADMQTGRIVLQINRIAANEGIKVIVELNILGKILLNLDQIIAELTPKYDMQQAIRRFTEKVLRQKMAEDLKPDDLYGFILDNKKFLEHLPGRLDIITSKLADGQLEVRINAFNEKRLTDGFQKVANRITAGLVLAAMIIGAALLMRVPSSYSVLGYGLLPFVFFVVAIGLGFFLVYNILFKDESFRNKSK